MMGGMKFLILMILISGLAHAKMLVVRDHCENQNWAQKKCQFLKTNPYHMNYRAENETNSRVVDLGGWLGTLTEQMESINEGRPDLSCFSDQGRLGRLTGYAKRITSGHLSPCQKACVVKCITSNYITYGDSPGNGIKKDSACQAANSGKGVCRSFANLADHLMDEIGLQSQSRSSDSHAFNKIFLNGRWYYGEPQDSECRFFER
jgi:hypothetical protein